jgi:hypothetical protein
MERALRERSPLMELPDILAGAPAVAAGSERLSPVEQLNVYREQFWLRHMGALEEDFPSLVHLLGEEAWNDLGAAYLAAHPPDSFTLRDLGKKLSEFVHRVAPYSRDVFLYDLARVEWAFVEAFDAADAPPLDVSTIGAAGEDEWARATVVFHPAMQRLALSYPADEYRAAVRSKAVPGPERPSPSPRYLVVYRGPENLQYIDIEPLAFALLEKLSRGDALGAACERLAIETRANDASELEGRVGGWFQQWAAFGWISAVRF